jgi:hypothetical protein
MKYMTTMATAAATFSIAALAAGQASADFIVTGAELAPPYGTEDVQVYDPTSMTEVTEAAGAIGLYIQGRADPLWVFCVDLNHVIYLAGPGSYSLPYTTAPVTTDSTGAQSGTGNPLTMLQSEEIATLADIGSVIANEVSPDTDKLTEIQGAIWQIEYGGVSSVTGPLANEAAIDAGIAYYVAYAGLHPSANYDLGVYPLGPNGQGFGTSQGFINGVPEPASWAIMILGMAGIGGLARSRRGAFAPA